VGDRHVVFVGVDTRRSSALDAVPLWSRWLGHPLQVRPVDIPLGAPPDVYVGVFDELVADTDAAGAVITSHKVAIYAAIADRCSYLSPDASRLRECTVVAARPSGMAAYATDVQSMGAAVDRIWPEGDMVLCLGAGGSAAALCLHLLRRRIPPRHIVVCQRDPRRAAEFSGLLADDAAATGIELQVHDGDGVWDEVLKSLPAGGLVVNATGLGKTGPESPVSPDVTLPRGVTVWDLNYRGPLPFLARAREQREQRGLVVHDGSMLFALGWLAALTALLDVVPSNDAAERFVAIAQEVRP
jgi:shikimate dehydrogenase